MTILGAPAEEGYGGKIDLVRMGAFNNVDAALMAHPDAYDDREPIMLAREGYV